MKATKVTKTTKATKKQKNEKKTGKNVSKLYRDFGVRSYTDENGDIEIR